MSAPAPASNQKREIVDGMLFCITCKQNKSTDDFYVDKSRNPPYKSECKDCLCVRSRARTASLDPEVKRARRLLFKFKMTLEQYAEMLAAQGGVCALCGQPETLEKNGQVLPLAVDHDRSCCPGERSCGKCVRKLLCNLCNHLVGCAEARGVSGAQLDAYLAG